MAQRGEPYFERWQSNRDRQWYWHLKAPNHEIIARGEGHPSADGCLEAINTVHSYLRTRPSIFVEDIADPN